MVRPTSLLVLVGRATHVCLAHSMLFGVFVRAGGAREEPEAWQMRRGDEEGVL